jgi:uncharacterized FlaG/YvyC family protein
MDVSATGQTAAAAAPQPEVATAGEAAVASSPNAVANQPSFTTGTIGSSQTSPAPEPGAAPASRTTIASAVAKIFSVPQPAEPIRLDVSYRVERDPNVIVTVFSDPSTGREVAQFPPEILFNLAQFFGQSSGVTLDRSA